MESDFEFVLEAASHAVLIVSAQGQIVQINSAAESMFGHPRQEALGQPLDVLLPVWFHDTHSKSPEECASPATGPIEPAMGAMARHRDGREFFVDVRLHPATAGGVIAVVRDVPDRKSTSQECRDLTASSKNRVAELARQASILESVLNSVGEGVLVCDQSGTLLLINLAARRLSPGLSKSGEPLAWGAVSKEYGLFLPDKLTPYPADELPMARVLKGEAVDGVEVFVRSPGAAEGVWTTSTGRQLLNADGTPSGAVVVIRDTTARKLAQGALLAGQEAEGKRIARELHDSVSQDLSCLIMDMAKLQRELPEASRDFCGRLNSQKEMLIALAGEVDSVCRQLHPSVLERIGLHQAMEELCGEFTKRKGLDTRFSHGAIPASLPATSALCLYRVAQEALRNIVRHARATRATVLLFATHEGLNLTIEDDGVGFDPKTADGKVRLGLVSMQERVRLVGGSLSIHSEPGHGTRINLRLPVLDESHPPESDVVPLAPVAALEIAFPHHRALTA